MSKIQHTDLFSKISLRKHLLRNLLWIQVLAIMVLIAFFLGQAFAATPEVKMLGQKHEQYVRARPATTTTTTTTTTAPPVKQKGGQTEQVAVHQIVAPTGDWVAQCHAWASEAGITLPPSAITLIGRESHCNPNAQNKSSSACGIAQNIRGCDSPGYGYNPITQLQWMQNYVNGRYNGWDGALAHSNNKGWY